ncbi:MAG: S49 family peptidase [Proteobacteria bacterium]|nr:S49 family peptidase [Pseudomonadota bacterium]MBU1449534.1 S49 family peptidase [Pseudomonadota bacterium]MBU2467019.1 S49 family peptidase [Pseudomonadota bacterium]
MPNWNEILEEVEDKKREGLQAVDLIRRKYLRKLHEKTGRNVIAYYSGWLSKPGIRGTEINDEDKNGFMMAVNKLDREKGLDLILHTPGGEIAATESIVNYLRKMFGSNIRAIVPQIAMSGGTMIACSCKSIVMGKQSNLGPIDPQIGGIPAQGVILEFERALSEIKQDLDTLQLWSLIIGQYPPTFLSRCENAVERSKQFVKNQLAAVMFQNISLEKRAYLADQVVDKLTDYDENRGHDRHIHSEDCESMGLVIERLEDDDELQDLVLTVHHCYMHTLMNYPVTKITENQLGVALVKTGAVPNQG